MWNSRHLFIVLPTIIAAVLFSPEARTDAFDNLARDICFKVHGADAQSIRKYEEEKLYGTLRLLKVRAEEKRRIAKLREDDFKPALRKVEEINADIAKLKYFQEYNKILRFAAGPINQNALQIVDLKEDYADEENGAKRQNLQRQIDALEAENAELFKDVQEILPKEFIKELVGRLNKIERFETTDANVPGIGWVFVPEITRKMEPMILGELSEAKAALSKEQTTTSTLKQSFVAALIELREAKRVLGHMENLIRETEVCRADAKRVASRRDFAANFKVNCRLPEFDKPVCMHGTMWINFDAQGQATGQAGVSRFCATNTVLRQCIDVPAVQITGATGQVAGNTLTATVTYVLSSNRPRKDNGNFRFEGQVTPDGNIMPILWRGTGSTTVTENKFPLPPDKPYVITCSGPWATESKPACWDE